MRYDRAITIAHVQMYSLYQSERSALDLEMANYKTEFKWDRGGVGRGFKGR